MEMENLWPSDITDGFEKIVTPINLLRQQAAQLGSITRNLITADISSDSVVTNRGQEVEHSFILFAPALDNYRYELFSIRHGITLYPVFLFYADKWVRIEDQEQLIAQLKEIFASDKTRHIIQSLLAQSI